MEIKTVGVVGLGALGLMYGEHIQNAVSYTHLDVYKRQRYILVPSVNGVSASIVTTLFISRFSMARRHVIIFVVLAGSRVAFSFLV